MLKNISRIIKIVGLLILLYLGIPSEKFWMFRELPVLSGMCFGIGTLGLIFLGLLHIKQR